MAVSVAERSTSMHAPSRPRCFGFWAVAAVVSVCSDLCTPALAGLSGEGNLAAAVRPTPAATAALPLGGYSPPITTSIAPARLAMFPANDGQSTATCMHLCQSLVRPGAWWSADGPVCFAGTEYETDCDAVCAGIDIEAGNWFERSCESSTSSSTSTSTTTLEPVTTAVELHSSPPQGAPPPAGPAATLAPPRPDAGDIVPCIEAGVDYAGHDLFTGVPATTPGLCQRMCQAYLLCRYFTWSTLQVCYIKSAMDGRTRQNMTGIGNARHDSGPRACPGPAITPLLVTSVNPATASTTATMIIPTEPAAPEHGGPTADPAGRTYRPRPQTRRPVTVASQKPVVDDAGNEVALEHDIHASESEGSQDDGSWWSKNIHWLIYAGAATGVALLVGLAALARRHHIDHPTWHTAFSSDPARAKSPRDISFGIDSAEEQRKQHQFAAKFMPKGICKPAAESRSQCSPGTGRPPSDDSPQSPPTNRRVSFAAELEEVRTIEALVAMSDGDCSDADSELSDAVLACTELTSTTDRDAISAISADGCIAALDIPELEFDDTALCEQGFTRRAAQRRHATVSSSSSVISGPLPPVAVNAITNTYTHSGTAIQASGDADLIWASMLSDDNAAQLGACLDNAVTSIQPLPEASASPSKYRRLGTALSSHESDNDC